MKEIAMVNNRIYDYWYDRENKCMYAENPKTGERRIINTRRLSSDLSVRKAIAKAFKLVTFGEC